MVLTNAEKQQRYRDKLKADPARKQLAEETERKRWHERKELGKVKTIEQMTKRSQRQQRKKWRKNYRKAKATNENMKQIEAQEDEVLLQTPPTSPDAVQHPEEAARQANQDSSRQKQRGRKVIRKRSTASYRKIAHLEKCLENERRQLQKWKKQAQRARVKLQFPMKRKSFSNATETQNDAVVTPRKRARTFIQEASSHRVEKELVFHYTLCNRLREKYDKKNRKQTQILSKIFGSTNTLKKYRTIKKIRREFGISRQLLKQNKKRNLDTLIYERAQYAKAVKDGTKKMVDDFCQQDDISRATAGKKETVTRKKVTKQKRFLLATVRTAHRKFLAAHPNPAARISLSTFWRMKPFWVVRARIQDRETCLCKIHENTDFMHVRLHQLGAVQEVSVGKVVETVVCDRWSKVCSYRECPNCKDGRVVYTEPTGVDGQPSGAEAVGIWWWQWMTITEEFKEKKIHKTVKQKVHGTLITLKDAFDKNIQAMCTHLFNIKHQFKVCRDKKANLSEEDVLIHIDFAENWTCKHLREIQSAHYGGSNAQITLHTVVAYIGDQAPMSFCSVSDNNAHGPQAIWNHLKPVLMQLKTNNPQLQNLHVMSDGPVTQYRGRGNLHLMANIPFTMGFKQVWWNFSEANHGKGAADGVGAAVKQLADRTVLSGAEITNASSLQLELQSKTNVTLLYIPQDASTGIPDDIPVVKGVMKVHQMYSSEVGSINVRPISCYCSHDFCMCYTPTKHNVMTAVHAVAEDDANDPTIILQPIDLEENTQPSSHTDVDQLVVASADIEPDNYVAVKIETQSTKNKKKYRIYFAKVLEVDDESGMAEIQYLKAYRKYMVSDTETSEEPLENMMQIAKPLVMNARRGFFHIPEDVRDFVEKTLLA